MNNMNPVSGERHSVRRQIIQLTNFIKDWCLCPHLALVVHCLAKTAQKDLNLGKTRLYNLKMAEWHLIRKITSEQIRIPQTRVSQTYKSRTCDHVSLSHNVRISSFPMMPESLSRELGLPPHLKEVVFYITAFQRLFSCFPRTRKILLEQALKHLRAEIKTYEHLINVAPCCPSFSQGQAIDHPKGER